jgi:predicted RNase H-like HicB family nuclease
MRYGHADGSILERHRLGELRRVGGYELSPARRSRSRFESALAIPTGGCYHRFMKSTRQLTAIIEREDDVYVALCPELDIASQGQTVETARQNLIEALELFFEAADPTEVARRLHGEVFVTRVEVAVG